MDKNQNIIIFGCGKTGIEIFNIFEIGELSILAIIMKNWLILYFMAKRLYHSMM